MVLKVDVPAELMLGDVDERPGRRCVPAQLRRVWRDGAACGMKPTADLPFGSSANAAFATPGNGGSFGMADPDTGIGYGYAPNRLSFGLIDQRQPALRDTLDRDVLGERPQRPTQRQPPPEAPAGDLQPRRGDRTPNIRR
jgi:hypothetical protein